MTSTMTRKPPTCEWFVLCDHRADGTVSHPVLGQVPTCQRCADRFDLQLTRASLSPSRVVVRVEEHPMAGSGAGGPGVDRRRYIAVCHTADCSWKSRYQVVKVAAEDEARRHREQHRAKRRIALDAPGTATESPSESS